MAWHWLAGLLRGKTETGPVTEPLNPEQDNESQDAFREALDWYESEAYLDELDKNVSGNNLLLPSLYAREDYIRFLACIEPVPEGIDSAWNVCCIFCRPCLPSLLLSCALLQG